MTEDEKDYSDYVQFASITSSIQSLLGGFTFTAFTILLTELPDPSSVASQFTLFLLATLFFLFMSLIAWSNIRIVRYCKDVPPASKEVNIFNSLAVLSYTGLGLAIVLMLLAWNLIYLALASLVVGVTFNLIVYTYVTRPILKWRRAVH